MKCPKFRKTVLPLLMEGKDEQGLAISLARIDVRLRAHLDSCDGCRAYLQSSRDALGCLDGIELEEPTEREWDEVLGAIHKSVRKEAPVYRVAWPNLPSISWSRVSAVAAIVLVIFVGSLVYFRSRPAEGPLPEGIQIASDSSSLEVDLAFFDEIESATSEYDEIISEIDELIQDIDTVYAQLEEDTGEVSLEDRLFEDILT